MISFIYTILGTLLAPFLRLYLYYRKANGKEDPERLSERWGISSVKRPPGNLLWFHAASVGESMSLLPLLKKCQHLFPSYQILMTSGTVTSARLLQKMLPAGVIHQFVPLDVPGWVNQFLAYWQPNLAIFVESELWPGFLQVCQERRILSVLVNGRLSERSFKRWQRFPSFSKSVLSSFTTILAQSQESADRFRALGAQNVIVTGNLKFSVDSLPYDITALKELESQIQQRPLWIAASTHKGEEEIILEVHRQLQSRYPNLLTILVPRHPERATEIRSLCAQHDLQVAQRAQHDLIEKTTDVYLADTIGELGLFYRLGRTVFLGGSLVPIGGHNPIEPIKLGCAVIWGAHIQKTRDIADVFGSTIRMVSSTSELTAAIADDLSNPLAADQRSKAALKVLDQQASALDKVCEVLRGIV